MTQRAAMRRGAILIALFVATSANSFAQDADTSTTAAAERAEKAEQKRLLELGKQYDSIAHSQGLSEDSKAQAGQPGATSTDLLMLLIKMVLALGTVCLLIYLALGKGLPKLLRIQPPTAHKRLMKVVDRLPIDQRRSIMILQMGELYFLVGVTEQGINLLSRLDADDVEHALADEDSPKLGKLAETLLGRSQKESRP